MKIALTYFLLYLKVPSSRTTVGYSLLFLFCSGMVAPLSCIGLL